MNKEKKISELVEKGYTIVLRTEAYTTLEAPKKFSWTAFLLLSIVLNIFGMIGYLIYYGVKKTGKRVTI